jgi:hypothetical protein
LREKAAKFYRMNTGRREKMFLGIPDFSIIAVYLLCIFSTLACLAYGLYNWNKGGENEVQQMKEKTDLEKV